MLLSVLQISEAFGISQTQISLFISSGMPTTKKNGIYMIKICDMHNSLVTKIQQELFTGENTSGVLSVNQEKASLARSTRIKINQAIREKANELISIKKVTTLFEGLILANKGRIENLSPSIKDRLNLSNSQGEEIDSLINDILDDMSNNQPLTMLSDELIDGTTSDAQHGDLSKSADESTHEAIEALGEPHA